MPAPTVSSISPTSGPLTGATSVTITGSDFTGATAVTIGGAAATGITVASSTSITCTTPTGTAGTASVLVTTPSGTNAANTLYTYRAAPTITGISAALGPYGGSTYVTLTGTNFTGATSVTFGGTAALSVNVVSSTTITCYTPGHSVGAVSVQVTTPGGTNATNTLFTFVSAPTVSAISAVSGPTGGGATVTITGASLTGATAVTIGGASATSITVVNDSTLTCITPAHGTGTASVLVTTPGGTNASNTLYTYVVAPIVSSITPTSGTVNGGTSVTITGINFTGATGVSFGGAAATSVTVVSDTSITCTTALGSVGAASVQVTTAGGPNTANTLYTYVLTPPTITDMAPFTGSTTGGTSVTITGTNFTAATGVTFRGVPATGVTVVSATSIICTTPAGTLGSASVQITTPSGTASSSIFTYVPPQPTVSSITPNTGSILGGTTVTITGTNLSGTGGVTIGGVPATNLTVIGSTSLTCITPVGSVGTASVAVTTLGGSSNDNSLFTYALTKPAVSGISPTSGTSEGGTAVTISGANFTGATGVTFGGTAATRVILVDDSTITCTTPAGSAGTAKNVVVTTPNGANVNTVPFSYVSAFPTVSSISPPIGTAAGGTNVTISGKHYTGATSVSIGGVVVPSFTVVNDTTITCATPAGLAGTASVLVTVAAGTSSNNSLFTYVTSTPSDTFIYLKGGRGDGFVPLWTGVLAEEGTTEKGEPYRNEFQTTVQLDNSSSFSNSLGLSGSGSFGMSASSSSMNSGAGSSVGFGGQMTTPGHLTKVAIIKEIIGATSQAVNITPTFGSLSDSAAGVEPRQFDKTSTWLVFISSNGLGYKFRKMDVVGWGAQRRE